MSRTLKQNVDSISFTYMENEKFDFKNEELYVLFSGGTDSTFMLNKICKQADPNKKTFINVVYIEDARLGELKMLKEKKIADDIINGFISCFPHIIFNHITLEYKVFEDEDTFKASKELYPSKFVRGYLVQPVLWINMLMAYLDFSDNSVIVFGYNKDDCARTITPELARLANIYSNILDKDISVRFPIIDFTKKEILQVLKEADMLDLTWTCETPETDEGGAIIECGRCHSCKTKLENI